MKETQLDLFKNKDAVEEVANDLKRLKKDDLSELAASFAEHNKKNPCRCENCVKYRKIYFNQ